MLGAIYKNIITPALHRTLEQSGIYENTNDSITYLTPTLIRISFPWGSGSRDRLVSLYVASHKYVCYAGLAASAILVILSFIVKEASVGVRETDESSENIELKVRQPPSPPQGPPPRPLPYSTLPILY